MALVGFHAMSGNDYTGCLPDFSMQIQGLQGPFSHFKPGFRGHFLLFIAISKVQAYKYREYKEYPYYFLWE